MPLTYRIDKAARIVYLQGSAPPVAADWRRVLKAILADPEYERGFHFLSDRRGLREPPTAAYIHAAAAILTEHAQAVGPCQFAVVSSEPATFGMYRMGGMLAEGKGVSVNVFRDMGEALAWLGIGPAVREDLESPPPESRPTA